MSEEKSFKLRGILGNQPECKISATGNPWAWGKVNKINFFCFGDNAKKLAEIQEGTVIEVTGNLNNSKDKKTGEWTIKLFADYIHCDQVSAPKPTLVEAHVADDLDIPF